MPLLIVHYGIKTTTKLDATTINWTTWCLWKSPLTTFQLNQIVFIVTFLSKKQKIIHCLWLREKKLNKYQLNENVYHILWRLLVSRKHFYCSKVYVHIQNLHHLCHSNPFRSLAVHANESVEKRYILKINWFIQWKKRKKNFENLYSAYLRR